ncbi:type III effector [Pseudomonas syringae pv. actinidiae]|uniref:hypothetical protein n=1 Tax=Pseudomonas syringae TaxID=317 RepID=UPI0002093CE8|nr:hypothetical protein [Pseudomonas syringae]AKT31841.1 type III effector AvrPto5 [Pseudomonas syringae pv. actinidiae ICMP 18884]AQL38922.1 type III effector [Pseudomonas syringae pv. actinidiae ICMP 9853]AYL80243.1 type III effector [Pseudomonas syringae pv. actinidiae str. Shaanxi_M228]EGH66453.1 type III effector protein AvrPto1 [Pseudomonas syringae pv. actinidiae str. M302091]EPM55287.1 type III effector protein AvrPto1 [Pseudomonas syringae pv. actinidiae ICMP 19103]EPM57718.1 type II
MGNVCVGGASMARQVNSPDRVGQGSEVDNEVTPAQLLSAKDALDNAAGLTRPQLHFINNDAPQTLREHYNRLHRVTDALLQTAAAHHRYLTSDTGFNTGDTSENIVQQISTKLTDWSDMREALDEAMRAQSGIPQEFRPAVDARGNVLGMARFAPRNG